MSEIALNKEVLLVKLVKNCVLSVVVFLVSSRPASGTLAFTLQICHDNMFLITFDECGLNPQITKIAPRFHLFQHL